MALLIDAYNVLESQGASHHAVSNAAELCRWLQRSRWANQKITVVCDGSPKPDERGYEGIVKMLHSGPGVEADAVIVKLIDADDGPRELTVVSNDRQIRKAAKRRRARVMSCERFLELLMERPTTGTQHDKPGAVGDAEYWMREFGYGGEKKD